MDNVYLSLTSNATNILNNDINPKDERMHYSLTIIQLLSIKYPRLPTELGQEQAIFFLLQIIGGHIGLPILLIFSIFSKRVHRNLIFLNFCAIWIFSSIVFSLG